ncbi:hypothetical protein BC829DRAFT_128029 [Chytridium lagenaria]|nr:hypothetical protein BC829DRAFT_128029 [Chytridium lagenaria]
MHHLLSAGPQVKKTSDQSISADTDDVLETPKKSSTRVALERNPGLSHWGFTRHVGAALKEKSAARMSTASKAGTSSSKDDSLELVASKDDSLELVASKVSATSKDESLKVDDDDSPTGTNNKALVPVATEAPTLTGTFNGTTTEIGKLTAYSGIAAVIFIITGFVLVFWGHHVFKPVLFISGFYLMGILAFIAMQGIEYKTQKLIGGESRDLVYFIVCIAAGLVGGLMFMCFWKLGMFAVGAVLGFVLATFILSFASGGLLSGVGRTIFIVIMVLIFGFTIYFLERPLLILGTAIPGSYAVILGVDLFARVGFANASQSFLSGNNNYEVTPKVWVMIAAFLLLSLIGIVFQFRSGKKSGHHKGLLERDQMRGKN